MRSDARWSLPEALEGNGEMTVSGKPGVARPRRSDAPSACAQDRLRVPQASLLTWFPLEPCKERIDPEPLLSTEDTSGVAVL